METGTSGRGRSGGLTQENDTRGLHGWVRQESWQVERPGQQLLSVVPGMTGDEGREGGNGNERRQTTTEAPPTKVTLGTVPGLQYGDWRRGGADRSS